MLSGEKFVSEIRGSDHSHNTAKTILITIIREVIKSFSPRQHKNAPSSAYLKYYINLNYIGGFF